MKNDNEIEVLQNIFAVANDENFSDKEALNIIMSIIEERLATFGMFPEGADENN
jgi:hypothetical protein